MDQAPAALRDILGSAFGEIREEINELKKSNTSLLKKVDGLEAGLQESRKVNDELTAAVVDFESRAETSDKQLKESCAKVVQLEKTLRRVWENARDQSKMMNELRVALTGAQHETAKLKLLLAAKHEASRYGLYLLRTVPSNHKADIA